MVRQTISKLNALLAIQMQQRQQFKRTMIKVLGVIVMILFVAAIYPRWTEMWHEFGQNLYRMLH